VLAEDRGEKIEVIEQQRDRIERLKAQDPSVSGGEFQKSRRVDSMQRHLEKLKIFADINDPMVKKRFEDDQGMLMLKILITWQLLIRTSLLQVT